MGELDHFIKDRLRVVGYLRYMDDFLLFGPTRSALHGLHFEIREFLCKCLALKLKDPVTLLAPVHEGIPFLGFRVFPATIRLPQKGLARFRRKFHARETDFHTDTINEMLLPRSVGSMIGHMAHADTLAMRRQMFTAVVDLG
ncbi:MAG: RNA-directed DNA polymerase [Magnetococcus sp. THC-1_WYH]